MNYLQTLQPFLAAAGLGVGFVGLVAEHVGIAGTVHSLIWLPILAGLFGLTLKGDKVRAPSAP